MKTITALMLSCLMALVISIPAHAQKSQNMGEGGKSGGLVNVNIKLYDIELVTQDGKPVKFKSEVIGDKLVAMTFIFTSCTTICPVYNAIFSQLQELLGDRQGKEVILISISIDPTRDVPLRMKREANKFGAKAGWYYLTGEKRNVEEVLKGLDAYFPSFEDHPPTALVGDGKTGTWKRFNGFPMPKQLLAMIDEFAAARQ